MRRSASRRSGWEYGEPIVIGDNVWLGAGATVCPGVTIGEDSVVGAGAVGCYFGAMLARAGVPVTLIGRATHVDAIRRDGLFIERSDFREYVRVDADVAISSASDAAVVLLDLGRVLQLRTRCPIGLKRHIFRRGHRVLDKACVQRFPPEMLEVAAVVMVHPPAAPGLGDSYLARYGYESQQTSEPKDPAQPDNLWDPADNDRDFGAHGRFDDRAGGFFDPAEQPGLASFTASLMREGTATRTSNQISAQLDLMAATLNVNAGNTSTEATLTGSSFSDEASTLFELAADVLLHPAFAADEVARFKQRTGTNLAQQRANPNFLAAEMFARAVYGSHPAARVAPTVRSLNRTTREHLVEFHRTHYVPNGGVLAVAGDISLAQAKVMAESRLGAWKRSVPAAVGSPAPVVGPIPDPEPITGSKIYFVARPSSVQTNLIVGTQAIERTNPDYDVLQVMNKVIGGGPTGRLFLHLRVKRARRPAAPG